VTFIVIKLLLVISNVSVEASQLITYFKTRNFHFTIFTTSRSTNFRQFFFVSCLIFCALMTE